MTTAIATRKAAAGRTPRAAKKKLRIRGELLPETARYADLDGQEYICIPVKDFGGWYEDIEDRLLVEEFERNDDGVRIPFDEVMARIARDKAAAKPRNLI